MKFNAFDYISPSIDDVKKLLFPFSLGKWMKLGFVSLLAYSGGNSGFNTPKANFGGSNSSSMSRSMNDITGDAIKGTKDSLGILYYIVFPIILLFIIFGFIMTYVTSVFSFIFIESLVKKEVLIKKSWQNCKSMGFSFFLFRVVIGLMVLGAIVLALLPLIIPLVQQGVTAYFENFSIWNIAWIIPIFILLILFIIIISIFTTLVYNFSMIHMYYKKIPAWASIKSTFSKMSKAKIPVFIFLLANFVISIASVFFAVILFLILLIPMLIIAIPFTLIFVWLIITFGWTTSIIVGMVIVSILFLIFLIYVFSVIFLPMTTFSRYFSIRNYKELMK